MHFADSIRAAASAGRDRTEVIPFTAENTAPLGRPIAQQWAMICCDDTAIEVDCSRQCGKTCGIVQRVAKRSWEHPGRRTLYINHTRGNAKRQFFDPPGEMASLGLLGTLDRHGVGYAANATEVFVELDNGSFVQAIGCDDMGAVKTKLGYNWHEVIIDEVQEYSEELLDLLIKKTLAPTLIKTHGTLMLAGTPPQVLSGFWHDVIKTSIEKSEESGYTRFHWTMLDNPVMTRESIVETMGKAGFVVDFDDPTNNHPIVQREIFGLLVADTTALQYEYAEGRNDIPSEGIANLDARTWCYSIGIDFGGVTEAHDNDSIVVLGWRTDDPKHEIVERDSYEGREDSELFCARIEQAVMRWRPLAAVCADPAGGGTKAMAVVSKHVKGLELTPKPASVALSQRLVNDDLRSGRMKLDPNGCVAKAAKTAQKGKHEPDPLAATRYAHHAAHHYLAREPKKNTEETYDEYLRRNIIERTKRRQQGLVGRWNAPKVRDPILGR